jgi:DNA-binding transcriptional LysR family regulator
MYEGPEFRHLRYFVALAEECSFHRAARLHVSQSALSMQIRQLEEGLDAKLFTRSSAGASLARAGTVLLPHAKRILRLREHAVKQASLANRV